MAKRTTKRRDISASKTLVPLDGYSRLVTDISGLLEQARRGAARSVNAILTATYWQIGRRIVEHEQGGKGRAEYGEEVLSRLSKDLSQSNGRGFSRSNLQQMRLFYLGWEICQTPSGKWEAKAICQTLSGELGDRAIRPTPSGKFEARAKFSTVSRELAVTAIRPALSGKSQEGKFQTASGQLPIWQTLSAKLGHSLVPAAFPLSWSHYTRLLSVDKPHARAFYESEAIRGGWSVRQLDRQISTQFFERTAHSKNPTALLARAHHPKPNDSLSVEEELRNPYLLEFLKLKDEYSESDLEDALIQHLESFLLELGAGFTFVARQKRIRIGSKWYRIDLLLFHRRLRCLVVIDLKVGEFTHADAGQMNLYLNYVGEHMMEPSENDPAGLILCSAKDDAVVHYAMGGIKAKVFASEYLTALPDAETLRREIVTTQKVLESRAAARGKRYG